MSSVENVNGGYKIGILENCYKIYFFSINYYIMIDINYRS